MAKNNESLNNSLFQLLRSRGYNPTLLGTDGKEIPVPDEAEVFQFHFIKDDKDYGPVTISIDGLNKLVIYYNDAIAGSPSEEGHSEDTSWFTLLNHLKRFSQGHQLSFELKNTDHLKYDMAKRNHMKKIDETKGKSPYGPGGLVRDPPEKEIGVKIGKGGMKQFKVKTPPKKVEEDMSRRGFLRGAGATAAAAGLGALALQDNPNDKPRRPIEQRITDPADKARLKQLIDRHATAENYGNRDAIEDVWLFKQHMEQKYRNVDEAAKWRQGYSASGHPPGFKHKSGEVGPLGGTHTNEPSGYDGDTKKVPVQKHRDKEDELSGRANTKLSTTGKPLLPRNAQKNLKGAIRQSAGKHGPVGVLPEGYYATGRKSSYSDAVPQVKIILQHSRQLEEGERRYRAIERIFVENAAGERFLLDTKKPGLARVYARHIAEGGTPYDEQGKHIHSLCEEYTQMAGFVRATRNGQFNESTQSLVNEGVNHYNNLRETLHKMAGRRGYNAYFESWTPTLTEDEDSTDLSEMFASTELDPRIESVMPILRKLNKNITEVDHSSELSEWADAIVDESLGLAEVSNELLGRYKKKAGKEASGLDTFANAVAKKGEDPAYKRAADWATKRANKRFSGIVKATNKEFANDNKPKQVAESPKSDFRNTVEQQQYATIEKIKNSDFSAPAKEYLIAINDPTGAPFRLSYRSFPRGQEAREKVRQEIAQKYNIDPELLNQADQEHLAGYGRQAADILNRINGPTPVEETVNQPVAPQVAKVLKSLGYKLNSKESMPGELKTWWNKPATGHLSMADLAKALAAVDPSFKPKPNYQYGGDAPERMTNSNEGAGQLMRAEVQGFGNGGVLFLAVYKRKKHGGVARRDYDNGLDPSARYDGMYEADGLESNNPEGIPESVVDEGLDANQKAAGQAGPTDKAPLKGKLVGACESVDHLAHILKLSKG